MENFLIAVVMTIVLTMGLLALIGMGSNAPRRAVITAQDIAVSTIPELRALLDYMNKFMAEKFTDGALVHLHSVMVMQLAYFHDTLGLIIALTLKEPTPLLGHLVRLGYSPAYNWADYTNRLRESLLKDFDDSPTSERRQMAELLVQSAHVVMPVRNKLATELKKAGIVWKS